MTAFIFCTSLSAFIVIMSVFYKPAKTADNKRKRLNAIKKIDQVQLDEALEKPFFQRIIVPFFTALVKKVSNLLPKNKGSDKNRKTEKNLKLAGLNIRMNEYNAIRLIFSGGVTVAMFFVTALLSLDFPVKFLILLVTLLGSVIGPNIFLKLRISGRKEDLRNQLPDVMDLLCVSMEAGLGFDAALIKIGERLQGVLVDELNLVHSEISLGKPRRDALRSLSERNPVDELTTFAASIIQAEKLGIPIKNALVIQAQELRIKRRQRAEEKAMKAPVKMLIPLVIFVLPVLFIVLLGPTILQVIDQFGGI
ncbi:type II secretion system F family protein [Acetobacterium bakii]|nr:type II secretion system F family protein [Acetobacterium bakii]